MMNRKLLVHAFAAVLALAPAAARAEHEGGPPDRHGGPHGEMGGEQEHPFASDDFLERMDEKLKLSEKQKTKVKAILSEAQSSMKAKAEKLKALREQMRAAHREMQDQTREVAERIRTELDNEQRERFDEMKSRMTRGGRRGGKRREHPGPMEEGTEGAPFQRRGMERRNRDRREDDEGMPPPEMWHGPGSAPGGGGQAPGGPREDND